MSMRNTFRRTAIHLALVAIFPVSGAWADDEVAELISPNVREVTVSLPFYTNVNPLYRQYDGVSHDGFNPNASVNIVNRSDDALWFKLNARNLGLRTQEMGVSYEKQGDWAIGLQYDQIPRYSPYDVRTAVGGVGSNTITQPNIANTAAAASNPNLYDVTLKTERDITTLTASKFITKDVRLGFSFKNEDKTGIRMDGVRGVAGTGVANLYSGFLFAPEPIDQNHKQFEAMVDYVGKNYQLTAGYYGSFLSTKYKSLGIVGGTNTATVNATLSPISLSPDNSMQQFYVNGAYNFSPDTRGNLKFAYSEAQQDDAYLTGQPTLAGIGSNLAGKVQTTELYSSVTSRVTRDLKLLASWRYEDRRDKTPVVTFYSSGVTNNPESHVANWGKVEADYRLGAGYSLTAGADYTNKSSLQWERHKVTETTTRAAIRKTMSETVNGTLSVSHAERTGSEWISATTLPQFPVYMADRTRNKFRAMVDWAVTESLNLQAAYEAYFDDYRRSTYGLDSGQGQVASLDGNYLLNDNWKLNAWYSKQVGESKQFMRGQYCTSAVPTCATRPAAVPWNANLTLNSDQIGFGVTGKYQVFDLGAHYLFSQDRNKQEMSALPSAAHPGIGVLPDTKYTQSSLRLNGIYPVSKATKVRLDYIYDVRKMDDYTWANWVYADGTRVYVKPEQTVQVIGLSLTHAF